MENKKRILIGVSVIAIIFLLVGVNVYIAFAGKPTVKTTTLQQRDLSKTITTNGTVELKNVYKVYKDPQLGNISEVLVNENQEVKKGDPLLKYSNQQLILEIQQNNIDIKSAYIKIDDLNKKEKRLREKLKELKEKNASDQVKENLQEQLDSIDTEKETANLNLSYALKKKDILQKQENNLIVKSKITGTVIDVNDPNSQNYTQEDLEPEPIIIIGDLNKLIVKGYISEYDSLQVQKGQKVTLTSDVSPNKSWYGKIQQIGYLPVNYNSNNPVNNNNDTGTAKYPVFVEIVGNTEDLKPGFQLMMEIKTETKKVFSLPISSVIQSEGKYYVYVVKDGKLHKREVKVGIITEDNIEIKRGISLKEKVVLNPSKNLKDGMDVKVND
ncbi:putative efflux system component YknX [Geobacillus sp. BCO2]|nr:putative efflux system component YknX [Geobacillus sp. BCO2]